MLLEQLKELREFGLVGKIKYQGYPLRVEYYLTEDRGHRIIKALEIMQEIGKEYLNEPIHQIALQGVSTRVELLSYNEAI